MTRPHFVEDTLLNLAGADSPPKMFIFSVGHTDIYTMRLFSVWPINFQHHSQAAATGYSCVDGGTFHRCATVQTFTEAESSVRSLAKR